MEIDKRDLYWLAGLLEAEGSFLHGSPSSPSIPMVKLQMTDEDIVARVALLFDVKYHKTPLKEERSKTPYSAALKGTRGNLDAATLSVDEPASPEAN